MEILSVCCCHSLSVSLSFIDQIVGSIDGLRDIHSGRRTGQKFTANNTRAVRKKVSRVCGGYLFAVYAMLVSMQDKSLGSVGSGVNQNQHFTSITYSSNGAWILASSKQSARVSGISQSCCFWAFQQHPPSFFVLPSLGVCLRLRPSRSAVRVPVNPQFKFRWNITGSELPIHD